MCGINKTVSLMMQNSAKRDCKQITKFFNQFVCCWSYAGITFCSWLLYWHYQVLQIFCWDVDKSFNTCTALWRLSICETCKEFFAFITYSVINGSKYKGK